MDSGQPLQEAPSNKNPDITLGTDRSASPHITLPVASESLEQGTDDAALTPPQSHIGSDYQPEAVVYQPKEGGEKLQLFHFDKSAMIASLVALALIALVGVGSLILLSPGKNKANSLTGGSASISAGYGPQNLDVSGIEGYNQLANGQSHRLNVNGILSVANSLILKPGKAPSQPTAGQIYYDQVTNQPYYYNGVSFVSLLSGSSSSLQNSAGSTYTIGNGLVLNGNQLSVASSVLQAANSVPAAGSYIENQTASAQAANFNIRAATSGTVAAVIQANTAGQGDIVDYRNGAGSNVMSVGATGNTVIQPSINSSIAFQVQNAAGTSILNVDTANQTLSVRGQGAKLNMTNGNVQAGGGGYYPYMNVLSGHYMYVVSGSSGGGSLQIFDISNPDTPTLVSTTATGQYPDGVAISGNYAYVVNSDSNNLEVFDIANPSSPSIAYSSLSIGTFPSYISISGNYAYIADSSGLQVVDISTPTSPTLVGTAATVTTSANSVAVSGNYAYVGESAGLQVFNISTPSTPTSVGSVSDSGYPWFPSIAVSGSYVYAANYDNNSLDVFNVSTPSSPSLVTRVSAGYNTTSVALSGTNAYVTNYDSNTLQIFSLTNPAAPVLTGSIATDQYPNYVAVSGNYAYVVNQNWGNGLQTFNVTNPASPFLDATSAVSVNAPKLVGTSGNYMYVVDIDGVQIFGITNPSLPSLVGTAGVSGYRIDTATISGGYVYAVSTLNSSPYNKVLQIFNVSNPSSPTLAGSVALAGTYSGTATVALSGSYAYVVDSVSNTLQIINVSNPSSPILAGSAPTGNTPETVAISGNYAYVLNYWDNTMQVFNISNPASVTQVGSNITTGVNPGYIAISGNYAYVLNGGDNTMQVFNISNPASVTQEAIEKTDSYPVSMAISGNYAYVTNGNSNDVQVFSLSSPASPTLLGNVPSDPSGDPVSIAISGNYVYLADGQSYIVQVLTIGQVLGNLSNLFVLQDASGNNLDKIDANGNLIVTPANNSTATLQVQDTSGNKLLTVDTADSFVNISGSASGGALQVKGGLTVGDSNGTNVAGIYSSNGSAYFRNSSNSTSAFQILNSSGSSLLTADTLDNQLNLSANTNLVKSAVNSGATFEVQDASGSTILSVDTQNHAVNIAGVTGSTAPALIVQSSLASPIISGGSSAPTTYANSVLSTSGLQSYWRLGETSGVMADSAVGGINGTVTDLSGCAGTHYVRGVTGGISSAAGDDGAFQINKDSCYGNGAAYVNMGNNYGFTGNTPFSVETWVNIPQGAASDGNETIISKAGTMWYQDSVGGWGVYDIYNQLVFARGNSSGYDVIYGQPTMPTGWNYVVATYDGTTMKLYDNGQLIGTAVSGRSVASNTSNLLLGHAGGDYYTGMVGTIDETALYNQALSASSVTNHYDVGEAVLPVGSLQLTSNITATKGLIYFGSSSAYNEASNELGINTTSPTATLDVAGTALFKNSTNSTTAFQVQNAAGTAVFGIDTANSILTERNGNSYSTIGAELMASNTNFSSGWSGNSWSNTVSGATHTSGSTAADVYSGFTPVVGTTYQITFAFSGATNNGTNGITPNIGGNSGQILYDSSSTGETQLITAGTTGSLEFIPTSGWTGTITSVSVMPVSASNSSIDLQDSSGNLALQVRPSDSIDTFIGFDSGMSYASGGFGDNVGLGAYSLQNTTTGYSNEAIGTFTLQANTTGKNNTAIGDSALAFNTTGNSNIGIGDYALLNNITGTGDTAIGAGTGFGALTTENTANSYDTFLGYGAASLNATLLQDSTAIGAYSTVTKNNSLVLGCVNGVNSCTATTEVGIDTTAPGNLLSIGALTTAAGTYQVAVTTGGTTNSGIVVQDVASQTGGYAFSLQNSTGSVLAYIDYQGNLNVKTATINGNMLLKGHFLTANTSGTTTATVQAALGTTGTCSLSPVNFAAGNDTSGTIVLTPGGTGIAVGTQCIISFASAYGSSYPHVIISPADAASEALGAYAAANSADAFSIGVATAGASGTAYTFNYFITQ